MPYMVYIVYRIPLTPLLNTYTDIYIYIYIYIYILL